MKTMVHNDPPRGDSTLAEFPPDFYWEQDPDLRFTCLDPVTADPGMIVSERWIGKTPWEIGFVLDPQGGWTELRETPGAVLGFRDQLIWGMPPSGRLRHFEISGAAMTGRRGILRGYRGLGHEVTGRQHQQEELFRFRAAMDASHDMIYIVDRETMRFVYVNRTACEQIGYDTPETLLAVPPHELLLTSPHELAHSYDAVIKAGSVTSRARSRTRDGRRTVVELHRRAVHLGGRWLIVSIAHDISQRLRAEQSRDRVARLYAALSATNEAILRVTNARDLYLDVCNAAVDAGQLTLAAVLLPNRAGGAAEVVASAGLSRQTVTALNISLDDAGANNGMASRALHSGTPCVRNDYPTEASTRDRQEQARKYGIRSVAAAPLIRGGQPMGVLLLASAEPGRFDQDALDLLRNMVGNVTFALENFDREAERKRNEERIQYLATHDPLTGLPNRTMFSQILAMSVECAHRYERGFAVLFIYLDRFKGVNDSLGHDAGDMLLREMAERLRGCLRASDVVARIGGDEFMVLVRGATDRKVTAVVARKILATALEPVRVLEQDCRISASIGIARYPEHGSDGLTLLRHGDMAMYQAKHDGGNRFRFYSSDLEARTVRRISIETRLRRALEHDELSLSYQAKTSLATGRVTGAEARLRWHDRKLGEIDPTRLVSVAEETGLIVPIGRWVLQTACAQNAAWQHEGLPRIRMAVNLSSVQLADPDLAERVQAVLQETGMAAGTLELEITETGVMHTERATQKLNALRRLGARIAIDDFGSGYSSLSSLRQLPIDNLKIGRPFIDDLRRGGSERAFIRAIVAMAKSLRLTITAADVETDQQRDWLRGSGCDEIQGPLVSLPDTAEAFVSLLREEAPRGRGF